MNLCSESCLYALAVAQSEDDAFECESRPFEWENADDGRQGNDGVKGVDQQQSKASGANDSFSGVRGHS